MAVPTRSSVIPGLSTACAIAILCVVFPATGVEAGSGPARRLAFGRSPGAVQVRGEVWPWFTIEVRTGQGKIDRGDNSSRVSLSLAGGSPGLLSGTLTRTVVRGVATFNDIAYGAEDEIVLYASGPPGSRQSADLSARVSVLARPAVTGTHPPHEAVEVPVDTVLSVSFSRPMETKSFAAASFLLAGPQGLVQGEVRCKDGEATFTPSSPLDLDTAYSATVSSRVKDRNGIPLSEDRSWSFRTVAGRQLAFGSVPERTVAIGEPWRPFSVEVRDRHGSILADDNATVVTVALLSGSTDLLSGTLTRTVKGGIARFDDVACSRMGTFVMRASAGSGLVIGATSPEVSVVLRPAVVSVQPAHGAGGRALATPVRATFSRAMDPATVNRTTCLLNGPHGPVEGAVTYEDNAAIFIPSNALQSSTTYTATVTTGIRDVQGVGLAANRSWTFTTRSGP